MRCGYSRGLSSRSYGLFSRMCRSSAGLLCWRRTTVHDIALRFRFIALLSIISTASTLFGLLLQSLSFCSLPLLYLLVNAVAKEVCTRFVALPPCLPAVSLPPSILQDQKWLAPGKKACIVCWIVSYIFDQFLIQHISLSALKLGIVLSYPSYEALVVHFGPWISLRLFTIPVAKKK